MLALAEQNRARDWSAGAHRVIVVVESWHWLAYNDNGSVAGDLSAYQWPQRQVLEHGCVCSNSGSRVWGAG